MVVSRVKTVGLANTEATAALGKKQDPYVKVKQGSDNDADSPIFPLAPFAGCPAPSPRPFSPLSFSLSHLALSQLTMGGFSARTDTRLDGGGDVVFDDLAFRIPVTRAALLAERITVEGTPFI